MKPGQQDPWRRRPAPQDEDAAPDRGEHILGTASSDDPLDWDLQPIRVFPLRAPDQDYTLLVTGPGVNGPQAAVKVLLRAAQNPAVDKILRDAGFEHKTVAEAKPSGFVLQAEDRVLWHAGSTSAAAGFRLLVQTLLQECRRNRPFRLRLDELGLRPLLP
jgi:hypothetical protein